MDDFVIRTKREDTIKSKRNVKKKAMKQVTIEALPRVVVVEEIERMTAILDNEYDENAIQKALTDLKQIKPSKEILLKTKIGHKINKLRRSPNVAIRKLASDVFTDWRTFYKSKRQRESIEVRCDAKTELLRMRARRLLADTLQLKVTDNMPELIEREVFRNAKRKVNHIYKRTIRKLCFRLKDERAKSDLLNGQIQIALLCKEIL